MLACVLAVVVASTVGTATAAAAPAPTQARSAAFYEYFECLTGVAVFLATNTYLILKVKRFGGVVRFAKRLWRAKSAEERAKVVASVLGYVSGTGALVKACAS